MRSGHMRRTKKLAVARMIRCWFGRRVSGGGGAARGEGDWIPLPAWCDRARPRRPAHGGA
uniref:Uncharacterized protein n=1 Tax=Setaria italica TaxID=4555 RepID=K4A3V6_SETIT